MSTRYLTIPRQSFDTPATGVRFSETQLPWCVALGVTSDSWEGIEESRNQRGSARLGKGQEALQYRKRPTAQGEHE